MALEKPEFRRRVVAALDLNGMKLKDLPAPLEAHGLPRLAAARVGHDSDNAAPSRPLILALSEILSVPAAWFEAEDWRPLLAEVGASPPNSELASQQMELLAALSQVRSELEGLRKRQGLDGHDAEETGT